MNALYQMLFASECVCYSNPMYLQSTYFRHQIELNMKSQLMSDLRVYTPHHHNDPTTATGVTLAWDRTQSLLHCCGIKTVQVL